MRSFNTAGPVNPTDHYLITPLSRTEACCQGEPRPWLNSGVSMTASAC